MKLRYWLPTAIYCALIFGLSARSHVPDVGLSIPHLDKIVHALIYAGLTAVVSMGVYWSGGRTRGWKAFWGPVLFAVLYALTDEFHQRFVPHRTFDYFDLLADGVGALLMRTFLWRWWRRKPGVTEAVRSPTES